MTTNNAAKGPQTREEYLAEQARHDQSPVIGNSGPSYAAQEVRDNMVTSVARPKTTTAYAADVHTDRVIVNGAEMLRSTYLDLLASGGLPPGSKVDDPTARRLEAEAKANGSFPEGDLTNAEQVTENEGKDEDQSSDDMVFTEGQTALDTARAELGADTVEALVGEAVATGSLDTVAKALEGGKVTPEHVAKVYSAYVASAQSIIAETGMSVETMSDVLGEDDLKAAREGVVKGDVSRVQDIAVKAVETLATLPQTNPEAFQEYIDRRFPDLAWKVEKGKALISTNHGWMPFDTLVRSGLLRNAKVDPTLKVSDNE